MLPLIILAGALAVAGGAGLYHLAKSAEKEERERKQHEEYLKSRNISHPVELVSANYRGRKKILTHRGFNKYRLVCFFR